MVIPETDTWYKADDLGYEGMSETIASDMLQKSNLMQDHAIYLLETINYRFHKYTGCASRSYLDPKMEVEIQANQIIRRAGCRDQEGDASWDVFRKTDWNKPAAERSDMIDDSSAKNIRKFLRMVANQLLQAFPAVLVFRTYQTLP